METGDNAAPITRREFYRALVLIWTFIALAFSTTVFRSRSILPTNAIYLMAALLMVANYTIASWRGDFSRKRVVIAIVLTVLAAAVAIAAFVAGTGSN